MIVLEARGLSRRLGTVQAVANVDLTVTAGEILGLLGPNGAGKSTTFKLLAGLEVPDRGSVHLGGIDVTRWPLHRRARAGLAYLPQYSSLFPRLTVAENLVVALKAVGRPAHDVAELLADDELEPIAGRLAGVLSGGERRRVEIARCLALRPKVVLLDEPFAGIDPAHLNALMSRIFRLAAKGIAVVLTDHQVREALATCDRAVVLDAGAVQVVGTPQEVADDPRARARYLGPDFRLDLRTRG